MATINQSYRSTFLKLGFLLAFTLLNHPVILATIPSVFYQTDSLTSVGRRDTLISQPDTVSTTGRKPFIESEVKYSASDSITFLGRKVFLFGDAQVSYQDVLLTAYKIELDLDSSLAYATGRIDSTGNEVGLPVFKDPSGEYTMRSIRYNFETEKAIIEHVVTEQGEGYVVSQKAKKTEENVYCLRNGKYTTCNNHDHPHFYLNLTKAKVIPGKKIITGPAYLVVEDVIMPIAIPFGFVPSTSTYSSGFILPSYGEESSRGFFLRDGGYYWAANDYFDLSLTGDIYSNLSWGARVASRYKVRYKFSGSFNFQYITNITSEKDLPDYSKSKDMSISWSHSQDSKANPYSRFSASVNFSTSSFDRNNVGSIIDPVQLATNTKRSSISYSRQWPDSPFNLSVNLQHSQNSRDTTIDLTMPNLTLTMNRIYPFKRKNKVGSDERWYEKVSLSYTGNASNTISTHESELFESSLAQDWKNGIQHSIPVSMNFKLFRYFTLSPSFSYKERWYFKSIRKSYDEESQSIVNTDTIEGFNRVYDYSFSIGTQTKIYTFYRPSRKLFGDAIQAIRHMMTPSVSMSYRPDFSDPKYGYYEWFEYYDAINDTIKNYEYSIYEGALYGSPGKGESASMSLGLNNNLEMKVKSKKDSTGYKKISILESLNFSTSYNFLADSMNLQKISMSGRTKIFGTSVNFNAIFDPYSIQLNQNGSPTRVDRYIWKDKKKIARLESASLSFGLNFGSKTFQKKDKSQSDPDQNNQFPNDGPPPGNDNINQPPPVDAETIKREYAQFSMPWNISLNYNMRVTQDGFNEEKMDYDKKITADVSISGNIELTKKWGINFSTGYSFDDKELSHTNIRISRDLHCWNMSFNLVPIGTYKSYFFSIAVNSSMLRDLKYEKRSHARDNASFSSF
ncbi:putative LPS assembly protein LptD [Thermophagus xiamenensis]|uniref:LPS assembly outer membrane protein LptD (Organic solvent tolerance protein OstA) n=1 Tax=Thermophagus xiamenensis TaxID=385682 RepID=A0A1I1W9Z1_9BACT|nr:putative LPS assembly protein LptD [Thermophagus xiamenensis]SFD91819.1 LPS assembly outer membrane protein LptD (organic solvent tolerance protein OstA) [Thermophagus xiamenensis]